MEYVSSRRYVNFGRTVVLGGGEYELPSHEELARTNRMKVIGAGFFRITDGKVEVFGESHGLGIKPSGEDAKAIETFLGL